MKEFKFINRLEHTFNKENKFIGDDAVLIDNKLYAKDILAENIHFLKSTPLKYVIHKLFTSNISDIASMGGVSEYVLLGIAADDNKILENIIPYIEEECKLYNVSLTGGDTTSSKGGLFLSLTVWGRTSENILYRSGAKSGDHIFISRPAGLNRLSLERELNINNFNINKYAHYQVNAENKLGALLGSLKGVTAMTDISDGLSIDLNNILTSSNKKAVLKYEWLPLKHLIPYNINHLEYFLSSGEEYSLLFTVSEEESNNIKNTVYSNLGIEIIKIGQITEGSGLYLEKDNKILKLEISGYEHFSS